MNSLHITDVADLVKTWKKFCKVLYVGPQLLNTLTGRISLDLL